MREKDFDNPVESIIAAGQIKAGKLHQDVAFNSIHLI